MPAKRGRLVQHRELIALVQWWKDACGERVAVHATRIETCIRIRISHRGRNLEQTDEPMLNIAPHGLSRPSLNVPGRYWRNCGRTSPSLISMREMICIEAEETFRTCCKRVFLKLSKRIVPKHDVSRPAPLRCPCFPNGCFGRTTPSVPSPAVRAVAILRSS